jgi:hypothetical protein
MVIWLYGWQVKTTIDLPDALLMRAKRAALERRTTLRDIVQKGLLRELDSASPTPKGPVASLRTVDTSIWNSMDANAYVDSLRTNWE